VILRTSSSRARGLGVPGSTDADPTRRGRQQRQVAGQQGALGEHRERRGAAGQRVDDAGHEPVAALGALVRVGVGAHRHVLVAPLGRAQLAGEHLGRVDLDDDLAVEILPGVQVQVGVAVAGEAVGARVAAAPVRVDGPAERQR
jgi:hypothetical protein